MKSNLKGHWFTIPSRGETTWYALRVTGFPHCKTASTEHITLEGQKVLRTSLESNHRQPWPHEGSGAASRDPWQDDHVQVHETTEALRASLQDHWEPCCQCSYFYRSKKSSGFYNFRIFCIIDISFFSIGFFFLIYFRSTAVIYYITFTWSFIIWFYFLYIYYLI